MKSWGKCSNLVIRPNQKSYRHYQVQKLVPKITEYDSIILVETWLTNHTFDSELYPINFEIYCTDRSIDDTCTERDGGIIIAENGDLKMVRLQYDYSTV